MNFLLLQHSEVSHDKQSAQVTGARLAYVRERHVLTLGASVPAAVVGGDRGVAQLLTLTEQSAEWQLKLSEAAPSPLRLRLVVGICRPHTIVKVLQLASTCGLERVDFIRCERAEKSYLNAHVLNAENIHHELWLGLEQSGFVHFPEVRVHTQFLKGLEQIQDPKARCLLADTKTVRTSNKEKLFSQNEITQIFVGPESGWSDFERQKILALPAQPFSLSSGILRVETACALAIGAYSAYIG